MKEKRALFDLIATQPSPEARFHGGAQYAKTIFFGAISRGFRNFDCIYMPERELDPKIKEICLKNGIGLIPISEIKEIEAIINNKSYRRFYSSLPYEYVGFELKKTVFLMDVLGLRELEMPSDSTEGYYRPSLVSKAKLFIRKTFFPNRIVKKHFAKYRKLLETENKHILTISHHSKYSLLNFFPHLKNEEISVTYAPIDFDPPVENTEIPKDDFFLLISANRWIKNNYRAAKALDSLFSEGKLSGKRVVVLGINPINGWGLRNRERFTFRDYVEENELDVFFKRAFCFIYPTLNEGFGYPPLQAMKHGTPVLAAAISAVPEICQDAVLYFNPLSVSEMRNRILQITMDKEIRNELKLKGVLRLSVLKEKQDVMFDQLLNRIFN